MRRWMVPVAMLLLLALSVPVGAQSDEARLSDVEQEIDALNQRIKAQKEIKDQRAAAVAAVAGRLAELQAQITEVQGRVDSKELDIANQESELVDLETSLSSLEAQIARTQLEVRQTKETVQERAVDLYMSRSLNVGGVLLAVNEMADVSVGLEYAGQVIEDSEALIRRLEVLEHQEELQQEQVEANKRRTEEILAALEVEREGLVADRTLLEEKEAEVAAELEAVKDLLAEVQSDIREVEGELTALEREQEKIEAAIRAAQSAGGEKLGSLRWPVAGSVSSPFGFRVHPISGVRKLHTGIDMSAGSGVKIVAAGNGVVILASWYGGYGNAVVIDHGAGLSTLYAHQSKLAVSVGQSVSDGEVIGYVGSTGYSTGPHLHFETREFGTPVDPMPFLNG
ncbi:MAG TPA: peptidoglycan DD-metalloendopeptidase family protein [Acidimicrobiia bacterium]|nr:peptidoglycan DD-metalloendopeptidase family protein [Acidimicrobiia bacterium]